MAEWRVPCLNSTQDPSAANSVPGYRPHEGWDSGRRPAAVPRYDRDVDQPAPSGPVGDIRPETTLADRPAVLCEEDLDAASARRLRSQHPELDWNDPEGAFETLALLNDPEAMADLEEADNNIANDDLLPLDRYAPPL